MHELSVREKERLAELVAEGTPFWRICEVIGRDRWTTRRNINYLKRVPKPEPVRSPLRLSLVEREEISRGLAAGESLRSIARRLGRAPSTISREVNGNHGPGRYRACTADKAALRRMRRPKAAKLAECDRLRSVGVHICRSATWIPQCVGHPGFVAAGVLYAHQCVAPIKCANSKRVWAKTKVHRSTRISPFSINS